MAIAWLFDEESTNVTERALQQVVARGAVTPSLWRLEVANVLRNAVRRDRCDEAYAERSLERLALLSITTDPETDTYAWGVTRTLARAHDLTVYDAAYLELALRLRLPLASCDAKLIAAAKQGGLEVIQG